MIKQNASVSVLHFPTVLDVRLKAHFPYLASNDSFSLNLIVKNDHISLHFYIL